MSNNNEKLNMAIFNPTNKDPYKISGANLPKDGAWATLMQWKYAGFKVRKGEHPTRIDWTTERGESRHYNVFHVSQCDPGGEFIDNSVDTIARIQELEQAAEIDRAMSEIEPEIIDQESPEIFTEMVDMDRVAEIRSMYSLLEIQTAQAEIMRHYAGLAQQVPPEIPPEKTEPEKVWNYDEARKYAEKLAGNLKLHKGGYYIHTVKGAIWVNGYTFDYRGVTFGIANDTGHWKITEISTGFAVSNYTMKSRKATLVEWFMVDAHGKVFADKVIDALNKGEENVLDARKVMSMAYADAAQGGR